MSDSVIYADVRHFKVRHVRGRHVEVSHARGRHRSWSCIPKLVMHAEVRHV